MRGRLWVLFALQASSSAFCCGLSRMGGSLAGTIGLAIAMALCCTAAAGATFGIGAPRPAVAGLHVCLAAPALRTAPIDCSRAHRRLLLPPPSCCCAVPFITRRGLGAANGLVGSGSSVGESGRPAVSWWAG